MKEKKLYERDYCEESDRTTTYEVIMNEETGKILSIELIMWHYGRPEDRDTELMSLDARNSYFEHDYNTESDRTTIYQVTVNSETGEVKSIRLHGWHQGKPYEGDEHEPSTLVMTAIL